MTRDRDTLQALVAPVVEALGCELWGLELFRRGKLSVLRIYIDKDEGVDISDCERVSRQLGSVLDVEDPIGGEYTLEVSSPGLDRPLYTPAQFERFAGHEVDLHLRVAFEGRRKYKGVLKGLENGEVVLVVGEQEYLFPLEGVEKTRVVPRY